jgi:hypothetical protein
VDDAGVAVRLHVGDGVPTRRSGAAKAPRWYLASLPGTSLPQGRVNGHHPHPVLTRVIRNWNGQVELVSASRSEVMSSDESVVWGVVDSSRPIRQLPASPPTLLKDETTGCCAATCPTRNDS